MGKIVLLIFVVDNGVLCHVWVRWIDKPHYYHTALLLDVLPLGAVLLLAFLLCYS